MKFTSKKIIGLLFFVAVSTTALFANSDQAAVTQPEVSDAELEQFAQAFQGIRMINQQAQQEMIGIVQEEGMEIQRFNEIQQAAMNPEAAEVEATEAEMEQHQKIATEIEEVQMGFQGQMEESITESGLSMERYQQIATQLQTDAELQERLQAHFEQ